MSLVRNQSSGVVLMTQLEVPIGRLHPQKDSLGCLKCQRPWRCSSPNHPVNGSYKVADAYRTYKVYTHVIVYIIVRYSYCICSLVYISMIFCLDHMFFHQEQLDAKMLFLPLRLGRPRLYSVFIRYKT